MASGVCRLLTSCLWLVFAGLCLCVCVSSDELQLVFSRISRSHPSRPYLLSVYIDQHNDYAVQQCEPPIERLPELLENVNRTVVTAAGAEKVGDFGVFVLRVRQEFQQLARAEEEGPAHCPVTE